MASSQAVRFRPFLLARDMAAAAALGLTGDIICQRYVEGSEALDQRRMFAFSSFSGLYTGGVCHFAYAMYPPLVLRFFPAWFAGSPLRIGMGCALIDNGIHSPLAYIPCYFIWCDTVQGSSFQDALAHLKRDWLEVWVHCVGMWIPLQALNFTVVPAAQRVIFVNCCNLVWSVVMDYLSHKEAHGHGGAPAPAAKKEHVK